jgi:hypothetical protein
MSKCSVWSTRKSKVRYWTLFRPKYCAVDAYHERRRRRRSHDTYFGDPEGPLLDLTVELDEDERARRRTDLMEEAEEAEMSIDLAEMLYDVAREEGIDPELAFEVVRSGIAVCPPDGGLSNAPEHPTTDKYRPEWLQPAVESDDLLRERALRLSFRRIRRLLEEHGSPEAAFRAFAAEPDVGPCGY